MTTEHKGAAFLERTIEAMRAQIAESVRLNGELRQHNDALESAIHALRTENERLGRRILALEMELASIDDGDEDEQQRPSRTETGVDGR